VISESKERELKNLHHQMRTCLMCLKAGYAVFPPAVFSGSIGSKVMIIGQAPGITEREALRPFNAGSGTRLFQWLNQANFEEAEFRAEQYMTSITKCYPGKASNGQGDRVPTRKEQIICRPYLEAEIELVNPLIIIPVGQMQAGKRLVVPLPHPSGASRWHQISENRERINRAIALIRVRRQQLGL
jgi:uracil-DNA glycosylase